MVPIKPPPCARTPKASQSLHGYTFATSVKLTGEKTVQLCRPADDFVRDQDEIEAIEEVVDCQVFPSSDQAEA